jgi:hypothetical protein
VEGTANLKLAQLGKAHAVDTRLSEGAHNLAQPHRLEPRAYLHPSNPTKDTGRDQFHPKALE